MSSYRPAVDLCARVSMSVRPFHLPAVTVDLGHYLESGVRCSEGLVVCQREWVCECVQENSGVNIPWYSHIDENLIGPLRRSHVPWTERLVRVSVWAPLSADLCWSGAHVESEGRGCVSGDRGSVSAERGETGVLLCLLGLLCWGGTKWHFVSPPDSQCRRTEWHSSFLPADVHKGFHCGFNSNRVWTCVIIMVCNVVNHNCLIRLWS